MYLPDWLRPNFFFAASIKPVFNSFIIIAFVSLFNIFAPWLVSVFATIFSFAASICIISKLIPFNVDREKAFLKQKHSIGHEYLLILM